MSICTSCRVRTTLAFIFMILQPCLASSEYTVRLFPAPGEPVSIRNRTPFFSSRTHNYRNSAMRSVYLSLKRNWEGMRVPERRWMAYPLRVIRVGPEWSSGPSRERSGLRLRSILGALFLDLFLVDMFESNINAKRRESHNRHNHPLLFLGETGFSSHLD